MEDSQEPEDVSGSNHSAATGTPDAASCICLGRLMQCVVRHLSCGCSSTQGPNGPMGHHLSQCGAEGLSVGRASNPRGAVSSATVAVASTSTSPPTPSTPAAVGMSRTAAMECVSVRASGMELTGVSALGPATAGAATQRSYIAGGILMDSPLTGLDARLIAPPVAAHRLDAAAATETSHGSAMAKAAAAAVAMAAVSAPSTRAPSASLPRPCNASPISATLPSGPLGVAGSDGVMMMYGRQYSLPHGGGDGGRRRRGVSGGGDGVSGVIGGGDGVSGVIGGGDGVSGGAGSGSAAGGAAALRRLGKPWTGTGTRWSLAQIAGVLSDGLRSLTQRLARVAEPASGSLREEAVEELMRCASRMDMLRAIAQATDLELICQGINRSLVYRGTAGGVRVCIKYLASDASSDGMAAPATEGLISRVLAHPNVVRTFSWHLTKVAEEDVAGDLAAALAAAADRYQRRQAELRKGSARRQEWLWRRHRLPEVGKQRAVCTTAGGATTTATTSTGHVDGSSGGGGDESPGGSVHPIRGAAGAGVMVSAPHFISTSPAAAAAAAAAVAAGTTVTAADQPLSQRISTSASGTSLDVGTGSTSLPPAAPNSYSSIFRSVAASPCTVAAAAAAAVQDHLNDHAVGISCIVNFRAGGGLTSGGGGGGGGGGGSSGATHSTAVSSGTHPRWWLFDKDSGSPAAAFSSGDGSSSGVRPPGSGSHAAPRPASRLHDSTPTITSTPRSDRALLASSAPASGGARAPSPPLAAVIAATAAGEDNGAGAGDGGGSGGVGACAAPGVVVQTASSIATQSCPFQAHRLTSDPAAVPQPLRHPSQRNIRPPPAHSRTALAAAAAAAVPSPTSAAADTVAAAVPPPTPFLTQEQLERGWSNLQEILHRLDARPGNYLTRIVMEDADQGSLLGSIRSGLFSGCCAAPAAALRCLRCLLLTARDISRGMAHLHLRAVIHGDLKPSNVLLRSEARDPRGFVAMVADFGLSRIAPRGFLDSPELQGTVVFMAPEVISGSRFPASDVYSFGVTLWQMLSGSPPWPGLRNVQVMMGVLQGQLQLRAPPGTLPPLAALLERCLVHSPADRPSFEAIEKELQAMLSSLDGEEPSAVAVAETTAARAAAAAAAAVVRATPSAGRGDDHSATALHDGDTSIEQPARASTAVAIAATAAAATAISSGTASDAGTAATVAGAPAAGLPPAVGTSNHKPSTGNGNGFQAASICLQERGTEERSGGAATACTAVESLDTASGDGMEAEATAAVSGGYDGVAAAAAAAAAPAAPVDGMIGIVSGDELSLFPSRLLSSLLDCTTMSEAAVAAAGSATGIDLTDESRQLPVPRQSPPLAYIASGFAAEAGPATAVGAADTHSDGGDGDSHSNAGADADAGVALTSAAAAAAFRTARSSASAAMTTAPLTCASASAAGSMSMRVLTRQSSWEASVNASTTPQTTAHLVSSSALFSGTVGGVGFSGNSAWGCGAYDTSSSSRIGVGGDDGHARSSRISRRGVGVPFHVSCGGSSSALMLSSGEGGRFSMHGGRNITRTGTVGEPECNRRVGSTAAAAAAAAAAASTATASNAAEQVPYEGGGSLGLLMLQAHCASRDGAPALAAATRQGLQAPACPVQPQSRPSPSLVCSPPNQQQQPQQLQQQQQQQQPRPQLQQQPSPAPVMNSFRLPSQLPQPSAAALPSLAGVAMAPGLLTPIFEEALPTLPNSGGGVSANSGGSRSGGGADAGISNGGSASISGNACNIRSGSNGGSHHGKGPGGSSGGSSSHGSGRGNGNPSSASLGQQQPPLHMPRMPPSLDNDCTAITYGVDTLSGLPGLLHAGLIVLGGRESLTGGPLTAAAEGEKGGHD